MSFFDSMRQMQDPQQGMKAIKTEVGSIKSDPAGYLKSHGLHIPDGMTDPKSITRHLLQTGQIGSGKLQQVMRMIGYR